MSEFDHIAQNLSRVNAAVAEACLRAGRHRDDVTLVAVSKTFPLEAISAAAAQGQCHFGENKVQELAAKCPAWDTDTSVSWHMIGHLQRNKAKTVAAHADVFHALDSVKLARMLDRKCQEASRTLTCFVQVNVSGEGSKFGVQPEDLFQLLDELRGLESLKIEGLMTLAAATASPESVRPQFRLLRELLQGYRGDFNLHSLSMGMSGDYPIAIEEGATHVRVGSAIFGHRSYL